MECSGDCVKLRSCESVALYPDLALEIFFFQQCEDIEVKFMVFIGRIKKNDDIVCFRKLKLKFFLNPVKSRQLSYFCLRRIKFKGGFNFRFIVFHGQKSTSHGIIEGHSLCST